MINQLESNLSPIRFPLSLLFLAYCSLASAQEPVLPLPVGRLPPRAELDKDNYTQQIVGLRAAYARAPADWPKPILAEGVTHRELAPLPEPPHPKENPFSPAKATLGKLLFFEPRLSGSKQMACASCHDPEFGWTDGRTTSFGFELRRNAPTIANTAFNTSLFWDGRAATLEEQAKAVLLIPDEMHASEAVIAERLNSSKGYRAAFELAFGSTEATFERVSQAIAAFERTIVGGRSKFDRFLKQGPDVLSDSELRGLHLFRTDARCLNCHNGPTFSDGQFHNLGLSYYGRLYEDLGKYPISKDKADVGKFKTPSLRNIGNTAPYMHNGLFEIAGVLNMYNAGMPTVRPKADQVNDPLFPTKSKLLEPLRLNKQDLTDLEAFLRTLDEPKIRVRPPDLPRLGDVE
jgi:cytochrome c peroxidase